MTRIPTDRAVYIGGALVAVVIGILSPSPWVAVICVLLMSIGVYLIAVGVVRAGEIRMTRHRHTFGPWETSWYLNDDGTKAKVCEQIQKCTGCGYIKRRKP